LWRNYQTIHTGSVLLLPEKVACYVLFNPLGKT
jgi:hypothetical protein